LNVAVNGITAGQQYFVQVTAADFTSFAVGRYAMTANFGTGALPGVTLPNTQVLNGIVLQGGSGQALSDSEGLEVGDFYSINDQVEAQQQSSHHGNGSAQQDAVSQQASFSL